MLAMAQTTRYGEKLKLYRERLELYQTAKKYRHQLKLHQIRLLTIIPGVDEAPPSCIISYHWQADYPEYTALS
jgi:hypothetical protein